MKLILEGKPIPQKRARSYARGKTICHYNSQKKIVDELRRRVSTYLPPEFEPWGPGVAIGVQFTFYFEPAKSLSKKKYNDLIGKLHTQKPDLSNLIKFYEDVFNGLLWVDDCTIAAYINPVKLWSVSARTEIQFYEIEPEDFYFE